MKRRRSLVIALLLVAALALGIGYATITRDLTVQGTAKTNPADIDVVFAEGTKIEGATANAGTDHDARVTAIETASSVGTYGDKVISFNALGLQKAGETVTAVFYVVNNNTYPVTLTTPAVEDSQTTNTLEHFSVQVGGYKYINPETQQEVDFTGNLAAGQTVFFRVTVTLDSNDSAGEISESFHVHLNATGVAQ